jgi:hypothetical protein
MKRLRVIILTILSITLLTNILPANSMPGWKFTDRAIHASASPFFLPENAEVVGLSFFNGFESGNVSAWSTTKPGEILERKPVSGLRQGEKLTAMDGKGDKGTAVGNLGGIYSFLLGTFGAVLQELIPSFITNPSGSNQSIGFATNPLTGFLIFSNTEAGNNIKVNPLTGVFSFGQNYFYAAGDINAGKTPRITSLAFSNKFPGATTTKLFGIDSQQNVLVEIADNGELKTIGSLGVNPGDIVAFTIAPKNTETEQDKAFASFIPEGETLAKFYSINLQTGQATEIGRVGDGTGQFTGIFLPNPLQNAVATCDIIQSSSRKPLGEEHEFLVKVFLNGQPVADANVNIVVTSGPNQSLIGTSRTDANGQADFNYASNGQKGIDTIQCSGSVQGILFSCMNLIEWTDAPLIGAIATHTGEGAKDITVSGFFKRDDKVEINGTTSNKVKYKECDNNGTCRTLFIRKGVKLLLGCPVGTPVQNQLKVFRNPAGGIGPPVQDTSAFATCP